MLKLCATIGTVSFLTTAPVISIPPRWRFRVSLVPLPHSGFLLRLFEPCSATYIMHHHACAHGPTWCKCHCATNSKLADTNELAGWKAKIKGIRLLMKLREDYAAMLVGKKVTTIPPLNPRPWFSRKFPVTAAHQRKRWRQVPITALSPFFSVQIHTTPPEDTYTTLEDKRRHYE